MMQGMTLIAIAFPMAPLLAKPDGENTMSDILALYLQACLHAYDPEARLRALANRAEWERQCKPRR